jgi:hypothetical protein
VVVLFKNQARALIDTCNIMTNRNTANNKNEILATRLFEFKKSVIPEPRGFPNKGDEVVVSNDEVESVDGL